jgi:hypothetical protein
MPTNICCIQPALDIVIHIILIRDSHATLSNSHEAHMKLYNINRAREGTCRLGGVVVSVLATGPKVRRFEYGQGDGF